MWCVNSSEIELELNAVRQELFRKGRFTFYSVPMKLTQFLTSFTPLGNYRTDIQYLTQPQQIWSKTSFAGSLRNTVLNVSPGAFINESCVQKLGCLAIKTGKIMVAETSCKVNQASLEIYETEEKWSIKVNDTPLVDILLERDGSK